MFAKFLTSGPATTATSRPCGPFMVTNRDDGSIAVIVAVTSTVCATMPAPGLVATTALTDWANAETAAAAAIAASKFRVNAILGKLLSFGIGGLVCTASRSTRGHLRPGLVGIEAPHRRCGRLRIRTEVLLVDVTIVVHD